MNDNKEGHASAGPCPCGRHTHGFRDHTGRLRCGSLGRTQTMHLSYDSRDARQFVAAEKQQSRRRAASAMAGMSASGDLHRSLRPLRSRLATPSSMPDEALEDMWSYSGCAHDQRPLTWYKGKSPVSLQRASFTDVSKHRDILKPPATCGDYIKELAWKRAFGHNPLEMSLQSTHRGDFATVDFQKHREAISPAATVYSRRRITDKNNRTRLANHGQRDGTSAGDMRWWSAEEMASCRSAPAFTSWHEQVA